MDEIPEDAMRAARRCYDALGRGSVSDSEHIARAILAERKRCAEVAKKEGIGYRDHSLPQAAIGAFQAAKAIEASQ